jgi:hypothetical protein
MRYFTIIPFVLFLQVLACFEARASGDAVLWREGVVFKRFSDPAVIHLDGGLWFLVRLDASEFTNPLEWTPRKERLILEYDEQRGAALVHTVTGSRFPIVGWEDRTHPIDRLLTRDLEANHTTYGMMEAFGEAARRWGLEIERAYRELERFAGKDADRMREAARVWRQFLKTDDAVFVAVAKGQSGTRWRVLGAEDDERRNRWQAERLLALWGELREEEKD